MSNCIQCNREFEAKREDAKCCSPLCRKKLSRDVTLNNVTDNKEERISVTNKEVSVTRVVTPEEKMELVDYTDEDALKFMEGKKSLCKKCDKEFTEEDGKYWYLIEVCLDCTKKS